MKIVIDARFWGPTHTGLGVYTKKLVENLAQLDEHNKYTLLVRNDVVSQISLPSNFSIQVVDVPPYTFKEQVFLPYILYRLNPDLVHFPSINAPMFYFRKYIVTVHDLIKHQSKGKETTTHSQYLYWVKYFGYLLLTQWIVRRASQIITPSQSVRRDLINKFPLPENKVIVTYEASALKDTPPEKLSTLPQKFAIYTGNAYPHKNLDRLISLWKAIFEATGCHLVISSGRNVFADRISKLIIDKNSQEFVHCVGHLSDGQLVFAYKQAKVYVFPTLIEGFGLPGLDAMEFGLPVVCSDIPVLKEIYGDAALYFDPTSQTDMQEKIVLALKKTAIRQQLISRGRSQVKKYSWQKMAKETLDIYSNQQINH